MPVGVGVFVRDKSGVGVIPAGMSFNIMETYPLKGVLVIVAVPVGVPVAVSVGGEVGVNGIAIKSCPAALGGRLTIRVSGTKLYGSKTGVIQ